MPEELKKALYTINEAKELLTVSDDTIRRMIKSGELQARKISGTWRIYRESLAKLLTPPSEEQK